VHVSSLKTNLLQQFPKIIEYAQADNHFDGVIASHSRPYHFYYDIWPVLVEISEKPPLAARIPHIIMRSDHDFNHADSLFDKSKCLILDSADINKRALNEHKWFIHVGTRLALQNRFIYERVDNALVNAAINNPNPAAIKRLKQLATCYPIVWIGVEGQKRSWLQQVDGYNYILTQLHKKYPQLGVIFDGWTLPITPSPSSIHEVEKDTQVVDSIIRKISNKIKVVSVVGETSAVKLAVGYRANFFISNFATGSMHISRILAKSGFGHLSRRFSEISLRQAMHIHRNNNVYLLPQSYVKDEDESIQHDWVSYSIDKKKFYQFIEAKLDKVLRNEPTNNLKFFIEIPYSINPEFRYYLKLATQGNLLQVLAGKKLPNKLEELKNYSQNYLQQNLLYDAFSYSHHNKIIPSESNQYLIWLPNPLQRLYYQAVQLAKMETTKKGHKVELLDILNGDYKAIDNCLTRMITDVDVPFGQLTEAMLMTAIDNLKTQFIFIGFDKKEKESFDLLCATMNWDRSLLPNSIENKFIVNTDDFSDDIEQKALSLINYDMRLYQEAEIIFNNRLKQLKL
jgi:hypothetical protein